MYDYLILVRELKRGLSVLTNVPREIYTVISIYLQLMRQRPKVEFITYPYMERRSES
ncbi:hypothetical protein DRN86_03950 [Candidatus Geothermarchaeota archaeon]|nr:MAG: hypothetical protein DRN86_03950 [Candidatus Geothermarchaeota archaeon]